MSDPRALGNPRAAGHSDSAFRKHPAHAVRQERTYSYRWPHPSQKNRWLVSYRRAARPHPSQKVEKAHGHIPCTPHARHHEDARRTRANSTREQTRPREESRQPGHFPRMCCLPPNHKPSETARSQAPQAAGAAMGPGVGGGGGGGGSPGGGGGGVRSILSSSASSASICLIS